MKEIGLGDGDDMSVCGDSVAAVGGREGSRGLETRTRGCMQHQEIACNNMSLQRKKCNNMLLQLLRRTPVQNPIKHKEFECNNKILHATTCYCIATVRCFMQRLVTARVCLIRQDRREVRPCSALEHGRTSRRSCRIRRTRAITSRDSMFHTAYSWGLSQGAWHRLPTFTFHGTTLPGNDSFTTIYGQVFTRWLIVLRSTVAVRFQKPHVFFRGAKPWGVVALNSSGALCL